MQVSARTFAGPALITAMALFAMAIGRHAQIVPSLAQLCLAPLFVGVVAYATAHGGIGSGLISAGIATGITALCLLGGGAKPDLFLANLMQVIVLAFAATAVAAITGALRKRMQRAVIWERERHATAERLSAALDHIGIGVVLFDADTRAEFINRAFRNYFGLPDDIADARPPLIALMYHGRDTHAYEMPDDELDAFIAERTKLIRAGDATPIDIRLTDGQVLRMSCTALPDGGRMLSYTPVTDLVRHGDDPAMRTHYLSRRQAGEPPDGERLHAVE